jgi:hypothetical protein
MPMITDHWSVEFLNWLVNFKKNEVWQKQLKIHERRLRMATKSSYRWNKLKLRRNQCPSAIY